MTAAPSHLSSESQNPLLLRLEIAQKDCFDQGHLAAAILFQDARAEITRLASPTIAGGVREECLTAFQVIQGHSNTEPALVYRIAARMIDRLTTLSPQAQAGETLSATEQEFLEDNIATVAFHLGQPGACLGITHKGPGLVVGAGEVLKEISRRLGIAQRPAARDALAQTLLDKDYQDCDSYGLADAVLKHWDVSWKGASALQAGAWQLIETYDPAHELNVLVVDQGVSSEAYYDGESDAWFKAGKSEHDFDFVSSDRLFPTHWMPMPAGPSVPLTPLGSAAK